ncbi:EAL domain-containing protein [Methylophaga sp. OBS3]|uniref:bifunctional diguanylate cyclase/phosphodiesterase n=1 Tax=Methylophaga sp. OBS3 TaxID=2991934 RepID=UPI002250D520|nr:EAL domain-containing protein [Methylophaga sp. OBS3]MCX4189658.1 EAL domain-containing protein [Methylophaga sp. OBS3]
MRRLTASKPLFHSVIVTIGLLLLVAAIYVNNLVQARYHSALITQTQQQLSQYHNRLVTNLQNHIQIVRGLPGLFVVNPDLTQADYEIAMAHLINSQNQLRNIAAAPDMVIRYMYPVEDNEEAIGLDYRKVPEQFAAAERSRTSGDLVLAGPLTLRQGGNGLITRIPVFLNSNDRASFWGIISAVIDSDAFFHASGLIEGEMPVELAIRGKDGLGEAGEMVWGNSELFNSPQLTMRLDLPDGYWQLVARPLGGWEFNRYIIWQTRIWVFGIALLGFILLTAFIRFMFSASLANLKFRNLIESSPFPYLLINRNKQFSFINASFTEIYGYQSADLQVLKDWWGKAEIDLGFQRQIEQWCEGLIDPSELPEHSIEITIHCQGGQVRHALLSCAALQDTFSDELLLVVYDITQSKQQQETLELMAHYDMLTKLPNRVLFADRFIQAVAHSKRTETWLGVCFLDLDDFKPINDNHGHNIGDQVLVQVAQRLKDNVRDEDTLSRLGGDEFAILFRDLESHIQCERMLTRIHEALAEPYYIDGLKLQLSASSGVAIYPLDDADLDTLLRHADQAMYQAKLVGRNTFRLFNPQQNQQAIEKHAIQGELRQAIAKDQLTLFYQPEINMRTGDVIGVEALIRWQHPEKGLVLPLDFLPAINGTDTEIAVGNWVIQHAVSQLAALHDAGHNLVVSINISATHLQAPGFTHSLEQALAGYPSLPAHLLQLEILETSALGDVRTISQILHVCREKIGVQVALDDFGTGYSSLTHLRHLAANLVKVDQTFVRNMLDDASDFNIIDGVIGLARAFNRQVIAEGVETTEHGKLLLLLNCELAQGYGIARPMPADNLVPWLSAYQPNKAWLDMADKSYTSAERALAVWSLLIDRWHLQLQKCVGDYDQLENLSMLDVDKCHCGIYLMQIQQQQVLTTENLQQFIVLYQQMHTAGKALYKAIEREAVDVKVYSARLTEATEKLQKSIKELS